MTRRVLDELENENARLAIDAGLGSGKVEVCDPSEEYLKKVKDAATATGDLERLSETDIGILAVALETGSVIVSDDYNIQNTAAALMLSYEGKTQEGIKKRLIWKKRCVGCGRTYPSDAAVCGVCGSQLKRKPSTA